MVALLGGAVVWVATRPTPPSVTRTTIVTAGAAALARQGQDRNIAITPTAHTSSIAATTSCWSAPWTSSSPRS